MKKMILLFLIYIFCSCEFRIDDEDAKEKLKESTANIQFGNLQVNDRNIHFAYTDQGKELLIVFVHGSPGSWSAFIDFFKADSLLKIAEILSIDRPGFGDSGYGTPELSLEKQAFLMNKVIELFPHKYKILIGHSLGGSVVARMAMDNTYTGIVLVASSIDPKMEKKEWYRKWISTKFGSFLTPKEFEVSNDEILVLKDELELMLPLWTHIKTPTIVIHGSEDSLVPRENTNFAKSMLPDSLLEVIMLEDVDHFIPWSHPQEIIKAINVLANVE